MLRIDKIQNGQNIVLRLSGRIQADDVFLLRQQLEQRDASIVLDLSEIQLVDESVVRFLDECESKGTILRGCADYIKEWIRRVSESK
jgi:anti-anti-sigma regulatory factor